MENENELMYEKPKMLRSLLHKYFGYSLGLGLLLLYVLLFFMGNPFVDGKVIGKYIFMVLGLIVLWFVNSELFFYATRWYAKDSWKVRQWLSLGVSGLFTGALILLNLTVGVYLFYVAGFGVIVLGLIVGFNKFNGDIRMSIELNTEDDSPKVEKPIKYNPELNIVKKKRKGDLE